MSDAKTNRKRSPFYGALQSVVDALFSEDTVGTTCTEEGRSISRLEVILAVQASELPSDLLEIVELLPPGTYTRQRLCDQLNSALVGHAWGQIYGTVE